LCHYTSDEHSELCAVYYNCNLGSEETSEPKPVPSLLVGYEQEWLSISPHALRYWVWSFSQCSSR